jgi:CheY-like chemotaxis protein
VLVVDDHATNVRILTRQLQRWGMQVVSADSGVHAMEWLEQAQELPDIVITDMHMPQMDGLSLARR